MRQIILDTETTGLSVADGDRVIEIGCVELLNRQLTGNNLHYYLQVDRDSHPDALAVHGITREFLSDKPRFEELVNDFLRFVTGAELIIHNAAFDVGFLNNELKLAGKEPLEQHVTQVVDSLTLARQVFPGKRNTLDALCDRFEIDKSSRTLHGALLDSQLLAQVYIHLTRGQKALLVDEETNTQTQQYQEEELNSKHMDLSAFTLPVINANAQELAEHEAVLQSLDKETDNRTIWRKYEATEPTPAATVQ